MAIPENEMNIKSTNDEFTTDNLKVIQNNVYLN